MSLAKLSLVESHAILGLFQKFGARAEALGFLGHSFFVAEYIFSVHRPPSFFAATAVDGSFAGDGDICDFVAVDARGVVPAR